MTSLPRLKSSAWRDLVLFQLVWLACAFGASRGSSLVGVLAAAVGVGIHVLGARSRSRALLVVAISGGFGLVLESALIAGGLVRYAAPWPSAQFAPAWIVALWLAFGTTLDAARHNLEGIRVPGLAAIGIAMAPLSYLAGARLGALQLGSEAYLSLLAIASVWAVALPVLLFASAMVDVSFASASARDAEPCSR